MAGQEYDWQRYWFDREGPRAPVGGYLTRPDEVTWLASKEQALQLLELTAEPCLILLGEPGLGKSYSVRRAASALEASIDTPSELVRRLDLRGDDNATLRTRLFESDFWRAWLEGKTLHLFLDSFDETLPRDTSFHRLLIEELEAAGSAVSRLRLRIVCRSAEWIPGVGDDLRRLFVPAYPSWTGPLPREMVLAQLRQRDVSLAAASEGLDPGAFLEEVARLNLQSLAAVPLTLEMLIDAARETGRLPTTRAELFGGAALRLVDTYDREQRYSEARATLSAGERLGVAQRIAAAALFSGRTRISIEPTRGAPGELRPAEISGESEEDPRTGPASAFEVRERDILEVLRTALFVDVGRDRVRFRHRSLAEYLAASYLVRHQVDREQLVSLFVAPGEQEGRLIPQVREVAAWMATMDPVALEELLEREPAILLWADRLELNAEQAALVVDALLAPEVAETRIRWTARVAHNLRALDHPDLGSALRDPLSDRSAPESVRHMAVSIARACERQDLESELLALALDSEAQLELRTHATVALGEFGSDGARRQLISLAENQVPDDRFRLVQGGALWAVFPQCLDLEKTLSILTEPAEPAPRSTYVVFLRETLPERITPEDLPTALRWAAQVPPKHGPSPDELNRLVNTILRLAWPRLQEPEIADLTVDVIRHRLEFGAQIFGPLHADPFDPDFGEDETEYFAHADSRRTLVRGLIERLEPASNGEIDLLAIDALSAALVREEDRDWVLGRVAEAKGGEHEAEWSWLARRFSPDRVLRADRTRPGMPLREELDENAPPAPVLDAEIEKSLVRIERNDPDAWPELVETMRIVAQAQALPEEVDAREANLNLLPGWLRAKPQVRERIVAGAVAFLEAVAPDTDPDSGWVKTAAGCSALLLLAGVPGRLSGLSDSAWARWASIALDFPMEPAGAEERELVNRLFTTAARAAPAELARWVSRKTDLALAAGMELGYPLSKVEGIRDRRLAEAVLPKLEDETLPPAAHVSVFKWLLDREPDRAVRRAERYLTAEAIALGPQERARAVGIALALLEQLPAVGWPLTKRFLDEDRALGVEVLRGAATAAPEFDAFNLSVSDLNELVSTVFDLFPPSEPGSREGDDLGLREEDLDRMRERLSATLAERGADESVALVEELHKRHPKTVPASLVRDAREARRACWNAIDPREVVEICCANTARMVFDDRGLARAVIASLGRIQAGLRADGPSSADRLWNLEADKPKYEEPISNWLAEQLELDLRTGGSVIDREVQAAVSVSGKGRAKSIDIKVTVPTGKRVMGASTATVFIEVKGGWNPELKSGMEKQLVERYLLTSGCNQGIYVVLWFPADGWDQTDSRRRWDGGMDLEQAEAFFAEQAKELSARRQVSARAFVLDCSQAK